jgi:hypothetical protein
VSPFEPGSFIMDIALHLQHSAEHGGTLFAALATQPEMIKQAKQILETLGLIKKAGEYGASLLELLRKLKSGKPENVEKRGDLFEYKAEGGGLISVSAPVHDLYNSGVVNNYIFNIAAPADRPDVSGVKTFLKNMEETTGVQITKGDVPAIRAFVEPPVSDGQPEVIENSATYMVPPPRGIRPARPTGHQNPARV